MARQRPQHLGPVPSLSPSKLDSMFDAYIKSSPPDRIFDFGVYVHVQRSHAINPDGLLFLESLLHALVAAQPSCRFLPKALQQATVRACLTRHADKKINPTGTPHDLFGKYVATRIGVVLAHVRQLARNSSQEWEHACAKLDAEEKKVQLWAIISLVDVTSEDLVVGSPSRALVDIGSPVAQGGSPEAWSPVAPGGSPGTQTVNTWINKRHDFISEHWIFPESAKYMT